MKITFISDTHTKERNITKDLPGGDLLICAGDVSSRGHIQEIRDFCDWFDELHNYDHKIFIAGNHDWGFKDNPIKAMETVNSYKNFHYLQDDWIYVGEEYEDMIKIYGSPWQPEFYNWAFNLPRNGWELKEKWDNIPNDTDILITHGPAFGYVDKIIGTNIGLGCELLAERIKEFKPKIHVCGHIHSGRGYAFDGGTHYINASVLNERYNYTQVPFTVDWDPKTNGLNFL